MNFANPLPLACSTPPRLQKEREEAEEEAVTPIVLSLQVQCPSDEQAQQDEERGEEAMEALARENKELVAKLEEVLQSRKVLRGALGQHLQLASKLNWSKGGCFPSFSLVGHLSLSAASLLWGRRREGGDNSGLGGVVESNLDLHLAPHCRPHSNKLPACPPTQSSF